MHILLFTQGSCSIKSFKSYLENLTQYKNYIIKQIKYLGAGAYTWIWPEAPRGGGVNIV